MALIGLSLAGTTVYESDLDSAKGTPEASRFKIGSLDMTVLSTILDRALVFVSGQGEEQATQIRMNEVNAELVRFGVIGWENFKDSAGNDIAVETVKRNVGVKTYKVLSDASLKALGIELINELGAEVKRNNTVTRADEKNSVSA